MNRVVPNIAFLMLLLCPAMPVALAQGQGAVTGVVRDVHGTPQMGALVELLSNSSQVIAQTFTDEHGRYELNALRSGRYEVRASSTFLLPVLRSNLHLQSGTRVLADLTMTAIYEVGLWFPAEHRTAEEPTNDWRWALRSSANRPLLRLDGDGVPVTEREAPADVVSASRATVSEYATEGELGTSGEHEVISLKKQRELPGMSSSIGTLRLDVGSAQGAGSGPSVDLRTGFSMGMGPGSGTRIVASMTSEPQIMANGVSGLQVVSIASSKELTLGNAVMIDAGTLLSAEKLMESRSETAPFLRVMVSPARGLTLMYRLATDPSLQGSDDLDGQLRPELLSDVEGRPVLVRQLHQEIAASHTSVVDTETLAVYEDDLPLVGLSGSGVLQQGELSGLPVVADETAGNFRITVNGYTAHGVAASWTHTFGPALAATAAADCGTAMVRDGGALQLATVQSEVHPGTAEAVSGMVSGRLARTGTVFRARYRWQSARTLDAVDAFNAGKGGYLGVSVRQRVWTGRRLGSVTAVLDATNLLEQGYQPVLGPDGETLFLAQMPRLLQAGLSFSF